MAHDVAHDLHGHEGEQADFVHGHESDEQRHEGALHDRFGHREGVGRPGGRRARQMVRAMEQREQAPVMHGAVRPVELGVVGDQHESQRQREVERSGLVEAVVDRDPALARRHEDRGAQQGEDQGRP